VYDLLDHLGVRWFVPGEYGEVVPKSATLQISNMSVTERPDFPVRGAWTFGSEWELWAIRHKQNPWAVNWFGVPGDSSLNG